MLNSHTTSSTRSRTRIVSKIPVFWCFGVVILGIAIGCGSDGRIGNAGPPPPHGGSLLPILKGKSFVEIVKKDGKSPMSSEVAFYFYKNAAYAPYTPEPDSGTLTVGKNKKITLKADGGGLVTPEGPVLFANRDVEGVLMVELGGEDAKIELGVR